MTCQPLSAIPAGVTQAPPFIDDYLLYLLARASHLVSAEFHRRLKRHGVGVAEWRVLASLSGAPGMTVGDLAAACLMQQPTMTKLLDRMTREGLVERSPDATDRRIMRITLTPPATARAAALIEAARAHEAEVFARATPAQAKATKTLLRDLILRHGET